jgi:hypothetical protein
VALKQWSRRAEITCDRAGLLCCGDLDAASRSFLKLATGSHKLYPEMNLDAFLDQFEEGNQGIGRLGEAFASHPYLPKRIHALRVFADSALYRDAASLGAGGLDMDEVDRRTSEIIQITDSAKKDSAKKDSGKKDSGKKDSGKKDGEKKNAVEEGPSS